MHGNLQPRAVAKFVEDRLAAGGVTFTLRELIDSTGLSVVAANGQIRRLGHRIARVSRPQPFFLIVAPQHRAMGAPPVEWWLGDYFRWLGHPYYLALLSAAEVHGAAPQAVQVHQVMTDQPRREVVVGRLRIRFFTKRRIERTPLQPLANAYAPLCVSAPEATALDLVRYARRIGGYGRALETITPLLPKLRRRELARALDAEEDTATAQRLGFLLETAGATQLTNVLYDWLPPGRRWVTIPGFGAGGDEVSRSKRWRVVPTQGGLP